MIITAFISHNKYIIFNRTSFFINSSNSVININLMERTVKISDQNCENFRSKLHTYIFSLNTF